VKILSKIKLCHFIMLMAAVTGMFLAEKGDPSFHLYNCTFVIIAYLSHLKTNER